MTDTFKERAIAALVEDDENPRDFTRQLCRDKGGNVFKIHTAAIAILRALPEDDEERCEDCDRAYGDSGLVWRATDELWSLVGWGERGLLCPDCFVTRLKMKGVTPYFAAVRDEEFLRLMAPEDDE